MAFGFDPPNLDSEAGGQLTEEDDFVGAFIAIRRGGAETGPDRHPQLPGRTDLLDIARAAFRGAASEQPECRYRQEYRDRNSACHMFTLLRTEKLAARFEVFFWSREILQVAI